MDDSAERLERFLTDAYALLHDNRKKREAGLVRFPVERATISPEDRALIDASTREEFADLLRICERYR